MGPSHRPFGPGHTLWIHSREGASVASQGLCSQQPRAHSKPRAVGQGIGPPPPGGRTFGAPAGGPLII